MIAILPNQLAVDCLAICSILYRCFYLFQNLINIVYFSVIYLFSNLFTTRQAFLIFLFLFICFYLSSDDYLRMLSSDVYLQMFLFIFRFEHYWTFSCHFDIQKYILCYAGVSICFYVKNVSKFYYYYLAISTLHSCFCMSSNLSNTNLFLYKKPSKWSSSTERYLHFGSF